MPVSDHELSTLAATYDIISLGMRADELRRARHGDRTTFVRVADVPSDPRAAIHHPAEAGELRIMGTPASVAEAIARVRAVAAVANGTPVSAYALGDLETLSAGDPAALRRLLEQLRQAGAELVADASLDTLADPVRSLEQVAAAGLMLARLTVRSGSAGMLGIFKAAADVQQRVGGVRAFAPLPRTPSAGPPSTGFDDVKRVALARIVVDNVPSIQVDWSLYGPKLAQVALTVGADDVDGVSAEEGEGEGRRRTPLEEIRRNIHAAGQQPVERNGRFGLVAER